jgi:undecaprenyl-diphosphatase
MNQLLTLDINLLNLINQKLTAIWLDYVMLFLTNQKFWLPMLGVVVIWGAIRWKPYFRMTCLTLLIIIPLLEGISSHIFKKIIYRPRPCKELPVRLITSCSRVSSFPSSHAVSSMGSAAWVSLRHPKATVYLMVFAFLIGYSRIYVGVHYPSDVLAGFILGWLVALLIYFASKKWLVDKYRNPIISNILLVISLLLI